MVAISSVHTGELLHVGFVVQQGSVKLQALERFHFLGSGSSCGGGLGWCGRRRRISVIGSLKGKIKR